VNTKQTQSQAAMFIRANNITIDGEQRQRYSRDPFIDQQRALCRQAARSLNATLIREYVEHGSSGKLTTRPELRLMLDELRALRDLDYLIVTTADRLTRRIDDWATITFELAAAGAELVIATQLPASPSSRKEATV
jgi:DNA invertase Pin-like site-specific DNA recombinase